MYVPPLGLDDALSYVTAVMMMPMTSMIRPTVMFFERADWRSDS